MVNIDKAFGVLGLARMRPSLALHVQNVVMVVVRRKLPPSVLNHVAVQRMEEERPVLFLGWKTYDNGKEVPWCGGTVFKIAEVQFEPRSVPIRVLGFAVPSSIDAPRGDNGRPTRQRRVRVHQAVRARRHRVQTELRSITCNPVCRIQDGRQLVGRHAHRCGRRI